MTSEPGSTATAEAGPTPSPVQKPSSSTGASSQPTHRPSTRAGRDLLALALSPENTTGWRKPLSVAATGRGIFLPGTDRSRELIAPGLRKHINHCVTGSGPWPLTLVGGVGTGKTLAAVCLLDSARGGTIYTTVTEMCESTQLAMKGELWDEHTGDRINTRQYWHNWQHAVCTVLDEIGARTNVTDHHYDCVKRALDLRERDGLPCVFISNLSLDRIATVYDDRIASRLAQGTLVDMSGPDRRIDR